DRAGLSARRVFATSWSPSFPPACEAPEAVACDRQKFWRPGEIPVGVGNFAVPQVSRKRGNKIVNILSPTIPTQESSAGKAMTQIVDSRTRPFSVGFFPTQYDSQPSKRTAHHAIGQTISVAAAKKGALFTQSLLAMPCLDEATQGMDRRCV